MERIYLAISAETLPEVDTLSVQGMQLALKRWSTLPEVSFAAHIPLLQYFQQILELQVLYIRGRTQFDKINSRNQPK